MRLICTLDDQKIAFMLAAYLNHQGIENQLDVHTNTDWGDPAYGTATCRIWVTEEDQVDRALQIYDEFQQNPDNPKFRDLRIDAHTSALDEPSITIVPTSASSTQPASPLTLYLLIACTIIFIVSSMTSPNFDTIPKGLPFTPILFSPTYKGLVYDYPHAYEIIDKLVLTYGLDIFKQPETLPEGAKTLIFDFERTPYWHGFYDKLITHFKHPETPWNFSAPLFEKIREGEIWRLFSPILLHSDIFHLLFNMIWLIILGKQIEQRVGKVRYIIFILIAAAISNTAQYLMSGPNFLGFSGVLCAMIMFIWMRQRTAAWEGYLLQTGTMAFITFFVLFMLVLQIGGFFMDIYSETSMPLSIANTAHIVGALTGYILAKGNVFAWQR